jgi:hypothetical protein
MGVPDYLSTFSAHGKSNFLDESKHKTIPVKEFLLNWEEEGHARGSLKPQDVSVKKTCFPPVRRGLY